MDVVIAEQRVLPAAERLLRADRDAWDQVANAPVALLTASPVSAGPAPDVPGQTPPPRSRRSCRDAKILEIAEGTPEIQRMLAAREPGLDA